MNWYGLKRFFVLLSLERSSILSLYLEALERSVKVSSKVDREKLRVLFSQFKLIRARIIVLKAFRLFFYFLLYVSVISAIISRFDGLRFLSSLAHALAEVVSTTFSVLMIALFSRLLDVNIGNLQSLASHIIAIYVKHDSRSESELLEELRKIL